MPAWTRPEVAPLLLRQGGNVQLHNHSRLLGIGGERVDGYSWAAGITPEFSSGPGGAPLARHLAGGCGAEPSRKGRDARSRLLKLVVSRPAERPQYSTGIMIAEVRCHSVPTPRRCQIPAYTSPL